MANKRYQLHDDINSVVGIGLRLKDLLSNMGIHDILDLLFYFPRDYKDYRDIRKIPDIASGDEVTLKGEIVLSRLLRTKKRIYEVVITDGVNNFKIIWFNPIYGYLKDNFTKGKWVVLSGKAVKSTSSKYLQIVNPKPENVHILDSDSELDTFARISPIYPLVKGLSQNKIQKVFNELLSNVDISQLNIFDDYINKKYNIEKISESILNIHIPSNNSEVVDLHSSESVTTSIWHRSFIFFEFLILCLGIRKRSQKKKDVMGRAHIFNETKSFFEKVKTNFAFELTQAQEKVLKEIISDMKSKKQMNRLLQGDVSSGKTIIALLSMAICYDNNCQSALIAPTEILADQHHLFLKQFVKSDELVILKSSLTINEKEKALAAIKSGSTKFVVGTHSLFQDRVEYNDLGLVVIDEQHRFGVLQRKLMTEKGRNPDILTMTATPIPRTLSSIFFSDFSLSSIDSLPPSRGTIETRIEDIEDIEEVFSFVKHELDTGRQAFVLCPLINKSDNLEFQNLADVESVYSQLRKRKLKDHKLAILHGRLSTEEKERTMDDFKNKKIDILVSTTVVEVGVDIPNASIMIIYNPERFGLSQLHQLRGRIGRGFHSSYCILLVDEISSDSSDRLSIFKEISDGFILSEKDLEIRGPGAFYGAGVEQSGKFWDLCLANLRRDFDVLKDAKSCSETIQDSDCYKKNTKTIDDLLYRLWGEKLELTKTI